MQAIINGVSVTMTVDEFIDYQRKVNVNVSVKPEPNVLPSTYPYTRPYTKTGESPDWLVRPSTVTYGDSSNADIQSQN